MPVPKRILMPALALLVALSIASKATAQSQVPPFIEVGKSYVIISMLLAFSDGSMGSAEVLEIGPGPWIRVRMSDSAFPAPHMWVNMNSVDAVFEMTPEVEAAIDAEYQSTRDRAYQAAMKSDLRNLATAQEIHFADNYTYGTLDALGPMFVPSNGVMLEVQATAGGWSAMARHENSPTVCAIFMGDVQPPMDGIPEGEPVCR